MNFSSAVSSLIPSVTSWNKTIISRFQTSGNVYLTIDDGPHPIATEKALKALSESKLCATFFVIGQHVEKNPSLVHEIIHEGHEVENHSYTHRKMIWLSKEKIHGEIEKSNQLLMQFTNKKPDYFRPPYGWFSFPVLQEIKNRNQKILLWNRMAAEFDSRVHFMEIKKYFQKKLSAGDIVVLHDNEKTEDRIDTVIKIFAEILEQKELTSSLLLRSPKDPSGSKTLEIVPTIIGNK